jgi:hypothetical protein
VRNDPEAIKQIEVGSVIQISPEAPGESFNASFRGAFAVVDQRHSWGVVASVYWQGGEFPVRLAWLHVEPTGGKAVFGFDGKRLRETAAPLRHHP